MKTLARVLLLIAALGFAPIAQAIPTFLFGDANLDGVVDFQDANLITSIIATPSPGEPTGLEADINADGIVTEADLDDFFEAYSFVSGVPVATALVDLNFDGVNDADDYATLLANQSLASTAFTDGNLFIDGVIDPSDIGVYLARGGVVPEPHAFLLLLVGVLLAHARPHA
ncbi:MAG: dockerin type I domain-containing protein [Planctomycetota bacterium]